MTQSKERLPFVAPNKKRGVYVAVYDLQGGPIPNDVEYILDKAVQQILDLHPDLAVNTSIA